MKRSFLWELLFVIALTAVLTLGGMLCIWLEHDITFMVMAYVMFIIPVWYGFLTYWVTKE